MHDFAAIAAAADLEIFGRLGGPVTLTPADGGGEVVGVLAILKRPADVEFMREAGAVRQQPEVHVPVSLCATLRKGDVVVPDPATWPAADVRRWRIAEAPRRPGRGWRWVALVEDLGAP